MDFLVFVLMLIEINLLKMPLLEILQIAGTAESAESAEEVLRRVSVIKSYPPMCIYVIMHPAQTFNLISYEMGDKFRGRLAKPGCRV